MKKLCLLLALASLFLVPKSPAISLDDIQLWTGSGTNRAALVVEWNTPEFFNLTTVPAPIANKTMVWGYRFNGTATGDQMFNAIVTANPQLYAVESIDPTYGVEVKGIGFNRDATGIAGVTDGTNAYTVSSFTNGVLVANTNLDVDGIQSLNKGDLFWSGFNGPYWQLWNETNDSGGFFNSPNRGSSEFWDPNSYAQGQWVSAYYGLSDLTLTDGSWIGFSVSAAGYPTNTADPNYSAELNAFNNDEQAPPSPDGTYVAYVSNTNDFAGQIISTNNLDPASPYNNPAAVLNRPTLRFYDPFDGAVTDRVSIIDDPYNVTPDGSDVITEISSGGQMTVQLGRKVYNDPNNPYGIDLIVYGNSFFSGISGAGGLISDRTDLSVATLTSSSILGHSTIVSVSQDGTNWFTLPAQSHLFPDNAYRWDDTNSSWTDEEMNPNKPINPYIYTNQFAGTTVAGALDQFVGASGGTGYSLSASGLPWIQYVQIQPGPGTYTVIDAIAAVNPAAVGDALCIAPDNLANGITNLAFQSPNDCGQNQISISFDSVSEIAKISTVSLSEFSSFAPVIGNVSSAYKIQSRPVTGTNCTAFSAEVGLRAGNAYTGNGSDLRVFQWGCSNWISQPFSFNPTNHEALISGVTHFSAFVISQIVPPTLAIQPVTNGFTFQFAPVPNCAHILERSIDLVTWTPVSTNMPAGPQPVTLQDTNAPAGNCFYRLVLDIP